MKFRSLALSSISFLLQRPEIDFSTIFAVAYFCGQIYNEEYLADNARKREIHGQQEEWTLVWGIKHWQSPTAPSNMKLKHSPFKDFPLKQTNLRSPSP
jgi:hypothetical protein